MRYHSRLEELMSSETGNHKANNSTPLKVSGPHVQTFCIEKDSHMNAIYVLIPLNDAFYSETKKKKNFLEPTKGTGIRTVAIWLHAQVSVNTSSLCPGFLPGQH